MFNLENANCTLRRYAMHAVRAQGVKIVEVTCNLVESCFIEVKCL